jgi:tetratricopeptide (TPR) repeat protein
MSHLSSQQEHVSEVDSALLDAELFLKYKAPERAYKRLRAALESNPRSIALRERLREIAIAQKQQEEAARHCLSLASLYTERDEFDTAYDRLLEAKQLDPRLNIAAGLEAVRRARRPDLQPEPTPVARSQRLDYVTLAGDLAVINIFDVIQVIENAKIGGALDLNSDSHSGRIFFNEGRIVDAESEGATGENGFKKIVEITSGSFQFQKTNNEFPVRITAATNTNLILDTLRHLDESKK